MVQAKYKKWLEKDNLILLSGWARDGLIDEQIASNMGINVRTLYEWKKKYSPIEHALKRGKEVVDIEVENTLLKKALGGYVVEEQTIEEMDPNGFMRTKKVKNKRYLPPDTTAIIFWLKNRKPYEWRDRRHEVIEATVTNKNPYDELTADELRKLIESETKP